MVSLFQNKKITQYKSEIPKEACPKEIRNKFSMTLSGLYARMKHSMLYAIYSDRLIKVVIARSVATCLHAEVPCLSLSCFTLPARRRGNLMGLLHFVRNDTT